MADRIAIMDGEPYVEWIERDGNAQRLYKACRAITKSNHQPNEKGRRK